MKKKKSSFTLIELLVVVAIIAILAALLLPTLTSARAKAYETICSTQAKQIYYYLFMYASDWRGVLPNRGCIDDTELVDGTRVPMLDTMGYILLTQLIDWGYIFGTRDVTVNSPNFGQDPSYAKVLWCPVVKLTREGKKYYASGIYEMHYGHSYSINAHFFGADSKNVEKYPRGAFLADGSSLNITSGFGYVHVGFRHGAYPIRNMWLGSYSITGYCKNTDGPGSANVIHADGSLSRVKARDREKFMDEFVKPFPATSDRRKHNPVAGADCRACDMGVDPDGF